MISQRSQLRILYRRLHRIPASRRWASGLLGTGIVALLATTLVGPLGAAQILVAIVLTLACLTDLTWRRVFNWLTFPALGGVLILHAVNGSLDGAISGAAGCFGAMLLLYVLFRGGEGDVKLFLLIGAGCGLSAGLDALVTGYLLAAAMALLLVGGRLLVRGPRQLLVGHLPMVPFFAAAVLWGAW